jgi:predicted transcriptional regulator of viral defense system
MKKTNPSQHDRVLTLLAERGMARLSEFRAEGIAATTISRMEASGHVTQLSRGLYQLPNVAVSPNHALALAAKLVPNGVICFYSALAFHGLAEATPIMWIGIGPREWRPRLDNRMFQVTRFSPKAFDIGWKVHPIDKVAVRIYEPAKTITDMFQSARRQEIFYHSQTGIAETVATTMKALRQRKTTIPEITHYAEQVGILKFVQPYLDVVSINA